MMHESDEKHQSVAKEGRVVPEKTGGRFKYKAVRAEQKKVACMEGFINSFLKPGNLVLDPCLEMLPTAKACMPLPNHLDFIGCEIGKFCIRASMPSAVETSARKLLNDDSDITASEDIGAASMVYGDAIERIVTKWCLLLCNSTAELYPTQMLLLYISHIPLQRFMHVPMFQAARQIFLSIWSQKWILCVFY